MDEVWLEKYRPSVLEDVCGNIEAVNHLKQFASKGNIPNMILTGPPGIGKTSSVLCLARHLLKESYKQAVTELNASDDRGIDVIREQVKGFATKKVNLPLGLHKIIILDEADSLTEGAQQALRMIISDYEDSTRFVLACNDSTKIIQPIQSRCVILRFSKLDDKQILQRMLHVIESEKIPYNNQGLEALIFSSDGDMRQAINNIQATATGFGMINEENVYKVCDIPNIQNLKNALDFCILGQFDHAQKQFLELWKEGYNAYDIVNNFGKLIQNADFDIQLQYQFLNEITNLKVRILDGLPTFLQISGFIAKICELALIHKQNKK